MHQQIQHDYIGAIYLALYLRVCLMDANFIQSIHSHIVCMGYKGTERLFDTTF